jgi:Tfp pilus assembly protein PilF
MGAQKITNVGSLSEFLRRHEKLHDRPFCWVLGSGASFQSGIPTGATLAHQWLKELHEMEDFSGGPLEKWVTAKNLSIDGFDFTKAASFYPFIYQRRFRDYKDEGYAALEDVMDKAEPSYGYSVLAQIMAGTEHKAAVTTNFDNLLADALAVYTNALPLVCGHESLTGYIRAKLRRPLIAKIHRDLLLQPRNSPEEIGTLPDEWAAALRVIFQNFTPIVIGYGGNDPSLMNFLKTADPIQGGIFWCHRSGKEPDAAIQEIVTRHHGKLVPILGFDELMLQLWEKLKLPSPLPELEATHDKRTAEFQKQFEELNKKLKEPATSKAAEAELKPVRDAADAAVERLTKEKNWWAWELKAKAATGETTKEAVYREGLTDFPKSAELMTTFAVFLEKLGGHGEEVAQLYTEAYRLRRDTSVQVGNYAWCLHHYKRQHDQAEEFYQRALELDPKNANAARNFAILQQRVRSNYDEAERLFLKAIEVEPSNFAYVRNYALFLSEVRKNYDVAEQLYRKLLELQPADAETNNSFGWFLATVRKDYDEAEKLIRTSLELNPESGNSWDSLAEVMWKGRKNMKEADICFKKALEILPDNAAIKEHYAAFRKDYPE